MENNERMSGILLEFATPAQIRHDFRPQGLEVCKWQFPAPAAEHPELNLCSMDLYTQNSGTGATTYADVRTAIDCAYLSGAGTNVTRMI
jgi:hypothetical protein